MKRTLIIIGVLLLLALGAGYYWYVVKKPTVASDPIDAIPTSAVLVVSYPDMNSIWDVFEDLDYYELLYPVDELQRYFSRNLLLDSLIRYDQQLKGVLEGSTVWSSYHVNNSDSLLVFHAIRPNGGKNLQLLGHLRNALGKSGIISNHMIGEREGFKLVVEKPYYIMYVTMFNGLVLMSSNEHLLQESIDQLTNGRSLLKDPTFVKAVDVSGKNVEANVLINYAELPVYLKKILKPAMMFSVGFFREFASWTELDVNLKQQGVTCNGFTYTNDSLNQFLNLFLDQQPQPIEFPDHLPANTASFLFYGVNDIISFTADYRDFLKSRGDLALLESKLDSLNTLYGVDLEQNILAWMGKTFGFCITEPSSTSFADETFWIFEARSTDLAKRLLSDLSTILSEKRGTEKFKSTVNGVDIGQLPLEGILTELFGEGYEAFSNPYFMVVNGYVVFGTDRQTMEQYLQYVQADRTLAKDLSFSRFVEGLGSSYNIFSYHHLNRSKNIFSSYLNWNALNVIENNDAVISNFEALGTQVTTTGRSFYSNVYLKYNPNWEASDESNWKAELDAPAQIPPVFVRNHLSNEYEVLVQDEKNKLYLFNLAGQKLFQRELPEPIESTPIQIDAFKNGKLQYVFNTKNFIYLIDRNGKDVEGFPVELNSPAETDLSVIEYDDKRDYRLLITCKNKHIYNYKVDGTKVKGWHHNRASNPTVHPFKHLYVKGKDYLITGESNGKIHLLDRRGKNRVKVEKYIEASKNNHLQPYRSSENAFTGVYITNKDGLIHRVALNGDVQSMDLGKFSPEHYFMVADLNGDGGPEFIFYDLNMLQVFNYKKEKEFEQRIDPSATVPKLISLSDGKLGIAFCYRDPEQLVLFDDEGKMVSGFPISGNSSFDLLVEDSGQMTVVSAGNGNSVLIQSVK